MQKLGLEPSGERAGGLLYRCTDGEFALLEPVGDSGDHTQMAREVEDIEATEEQLRARGVVSEEYGLPGLKTVNDIAQVTGNCPNKEGVGEEVTWFRNSASSLLGIDQLMRCTTLSSDRLRSTEIEAMSNDG